MERDDGPNAEQLVDHAWMVDIELLLGNSDDAATAAERLFREIVRHNDAFRRTRRQLDPEVAEQLTSSALSLLVAVALVVEQLRAGTGRPQPALRSAVERLIHEEAVAVGDWAAVHADF